MTHTLTTKEIADLIVLHNKGKKISTRCGTHNLELWIEEELRINEAIKPKMQIMSKKIFKRLSVDFLVSPEEDNRITGKYVAIRDKDGKEIVSGELYQIGWEDEDGNELNEEGEPL